MNTNKIIREIIPQQVRVRKYEVDTDKLKKLLRESKKSSGLSNNEIATRLNKPKTLVDHWFRNDNCFSIPDEYIWYELKNLLNIQTDEFDESITTFEIRDGVYDKSNRVYDANGIAPTLTCVSAENERYKVYENMNEIIRCGQVSNKGSQSGTVYNTKGIFPTVCACTHGYAIGNILDNLNNEGVNYMWNNNLTKYDFLMEEIRIADFFAGIGALHQSLKELGVPVRVTALSEIDIDATISYAAGHIDNFKDLEFEYPSVEEMRQWLINRNIGYSYEKDKSSVPRMKIEKLKLAYKASVLLNNLGDVSKIDYHSMEDFDLMNLSFACTDISGAGKQRGMRNPDGTLTRSGLYVYGIEAIRVKKPKYVMIENVKALIQKKFIEDFYSIIEELKEIGYNCYYPTKEDNKGVKSPTCLNSKDFGIPQNRERIYVIAIRKDIDNNTFEFPIGRDQGIRLKHILEGSVDDKYYLSDEIQQRFKLNGKSDEDRNELNVVGSSAPECRTIGQRDITYGVNGIMSTLTATDYKQPKQILDNEIIKVGDIPKEVLNDNERQRRVYSTERISPTTLARTDNAKIIENGAIRGRYNSEGKIEQQLELRTDGVTNTLTTVEKDNVIIESNELIKIGCIGSDSQGNRVYDINGISCTQVGQAGGLGAKTGLYEDNFRIRKLTPLECWRLQGFRDEIFYKAQELGISDSQLYKQAGNSITVNVLYYIFKNLFKDYIIE